MKASLTHKCALPRPARLLLLLCITVFLFPGNALAYIGPGAGFAFVSSLLALIGSFILAFFSLLSFPVRLIIRLLKGKSAGRPVFKRVVILGLDGLDPVLYKKFSDAGKLPNLGKLSETGGFSRLQTTCPPISPVAWSTFATGVNPGKHNIFDFLSRNPVTYLPVLSSSKVEGPSRTLKIGPFVIPLGKPRLQFLRKSKSFWTILGEHGIFSQILRVPITFPPERFHGTMLSAMCTPDLRGTQGSFSHYSDRTDTEAAYTGGNRMALTPAEASGRLSGVIIGPDNSFRPDAGPLEIPFTVTRDPENDAAVRLEVQKTAIHLGTEQFSDWIPLKFRAGPLMVVRGMVQFYVKSTDPSLELYMSPVNIDPEQPALPVSHPFFFSTYLAKRLGRYATLGLAEDTWALNEEVLDETAFLTHAYRIHEERRAQFLHLLDKKHAGVLAAVFDGTDRIQHTFFRYLDDDHPANRGRDRTAHRHAIEDIYAAADRLVGETMDRIDDDTLLLVLSDHGFTSFRRGINLNTWLREKGYLSLADDDLSRDYLQNVDWSATKAYASGLAGIYLNLRGREKQGIVSPDGEADELLAEIAAALEGLIDPLSGKKVVSAAFISRKKYNGPYRNSGPDIIVGYQHGYRVSWKAAVGGTDMHVFEDNIKHWSGDHCVDHRLLPGVLFSNHRFVKDGPAMHDIAPTVLSLFGITPPRHMDGTALNFSELSRKDGTEK